jgi:hypothetical protein
MWGGREAGLDYEGEEIFIKEFSEASVKSLEHQARNNKDSVAFNSINIGTKLHVRKP